MHVLTHVGDFVRSTVGSEQNLLGEEHFSKVSAVVDSIPQFWIGPFVKH